jgi:hypothetical protein
MTTHTNETGRSVSELRLVARAIAILALLTGLIYGYPILTGSVFELGGQLAYGRTLLLLLFLCVACAGLIVAWRWEGSGGLIAAASGFVLGALVYRFAGDNPLTSSLAYGSPFVIAGCLFLASWWRGRD